MESERKHAENCGNRVCSGKNIDSTERDGGGEIETSELLSDLFIFSRSYFLLLYAPAEPSRCCALSRYTRLGLRCFAAQTTTRAHFAATTALCSSPYLFWMMIICDTSRAVSSDRG